MRYLLHLALATTIGLIVAGLGSSPAEAQSSSAATCTPNQYHQCIMKCQAPASSTYEPIGAPVAISASGLYFQPYLSGASPLLGQSYDYLCHVCQPNRDQESLNIVPNFLPDARCTLNTFSNLFKTMQTNQNNVIRLETIFNHSPGKNTEPCCQPYLDEQPFSWTGTQWNLDSPNSKYLRNLGIVVKTADMYKIVVEVTLFNPWDGTFQTGPFYSPNEATNRGFGQQLYFASFTGTGTGVWSPNCNAIDPWTAPWNKNSPYCGQGQWTDVVKVATGDSGDNCFARHAQAQAIQWVVEQLKHYPNVIWEVANEPENFDNLPAGAYPGIVNWEQWVVSQIIEWDPKLDPTTGACIGPTPVSSAHPIQINGHYWDSNSFTTSAWAPNFSNLLSNKDLAESLHYAFNWKPTDTSSNIGLYGAIDFWRPITTFPFNEPTNKSPQSPQIPVGFNEGIPVPDAIHPKDDSARNDDGVRAEALEFIMYGGARFDGFSEDYQNAGAQLTSVELGYLAGLLSPTDPEGFGLTSLDKMRKTDCNGASSWCSLTNSSGNVLSWGDLDEGSGNCKGSKAQLFYSTMSCNDASLCPHVGEYLLYAHHGNQLNFHHGGYSATACTNTATNTPGYQFNAPQNATLQYSVPVAGCYLEYWQDPQTGAVLASNPVTVGLQQVGKRLAPAANPPYREDVLLLLKLLPATKCGQSPLTARFTFNNNNSNCTAGKICTFDASTSSSSNPSMPISSYVWDWGDETPLLVSSTPIVYHTFGKTGTYVVTLEVRDSNLADMTFSKKKVPVTKRTASASFSASCTQLSCTFDGTGSTAGDSPITLYSWNFGDVKSDPSNTVTSHTYAGGGSYDVALTVTDSDGVMTTTTQTITVLGPPIANFSTNCQVLTCAFDASSTSSDSLITSYSWTFGDGAAGSGVGPTHTYGVGGNYSVTLTVTDSNGQTGVVTGTVNVDGPPTANFTFSCSGMTCNVQSTSTDPDSTPINMWVWNFGDGTPNVEGGAVPWQQSHTYTSPGSYVITLTVYDTIGQSGTIQLQVLANLVPVAVNDSATTVRDAPVTIDVLANDSDADGDALSIANVNLSAYPGASYTIVQLANGRWGLTVTPPNAFVGTMTFSYQACDRWGACSAPATVTLTVTSAIVNALGDQFYCPQNGSIQIPVATLLANDYQVNGLTLTIVSYDTSILMGTLACTSTACTYTPPINAAGYTLFRYTISDPNGNKDTAPVRIYVGVTDQAPTAKDVFLTTTWNSPVTFTINDLAFKAAVDNDGDTLTIGVASQKTAYGTLACSTPMYTCTYTPNTGYAGTDRFAYTASDMINPQVTAAINVLTLPSPTPTFDARGGVVVTGVNQSTFISKGILANDYLPNGGPETVTSFSTSGLIGSLNCSASGCTYTPPFSFQGTTAFTYTANDSHGATDSAVVKICVGCTNHAPVATQQTLSTPKNTTLTFSVFQLMQNNYDLDDDPLTVTVYPSTAHLGTLSCGTPNYWCTYTPNANATGSDPITYLLSDGQTSVTSTVIITITTITP